MIKAIINFGTKELLVVAEDMQIFPQDCKVNVLFSGVTSDIDEESFSYVVEGTNFLFCDVLHIKAN